MVERHERLAEAIDIIQGLLAGEMTGYRGQHFRLDHARLFDRPRRKPDVALAAGGPEAARLAGEKGLGLMVTDADQALLKSYRKGGGKGPRFAEVSMCCGADEDKAARTAHRYFRWAISGWPVQAELPHEEAFAAASKHVSVDAVAGEISCGPSATRHLEAIDEYVRIGCDHIILTQIGPDQAFFFEFFKSKLAPALRGRRARRVAA